MLLLHLKREKEKNQNFNRRFHLSLADDQGLPLFSLFCEFLASPVACSVSSEARDSDGTFSDGTE